MSNQNPDDYDCLLEEQDDDLSDVFEGTKAECPAKQRKKRTSAVSPDYDPTPDYFSPPKGRSRPAMDCWVDPSLAKPLAMADLHYLWTIPVGDIEEANRKHRFLASKAVSVRGDFWVKDRQSGLWLERKRGHEIKSVLIRDWGRDETDFNIRKETISDFLAKNEFVVLEGTAYIPGAGDFVQIRGKKYLNIYHELPIAYRSDAVVSNGFQQLMELIVFNLMKRDTGCLEDWVDEITGEEETDLKWLFHWLASQYQRQGKALPTAVWFVGRSQGVGKGILSSGMGQLLGRSNTKIVSPEEFNGEWTDFLIDASFITLDEIDFGSRTALYDKIKRLIGNEMTAARKRNHGDIIVPSVANFMFTTNNTMPVAVEQGDRRNTFFATSNSPGAKKRARAFYELSSDEHNLAWEGMAQFLAEIEIDDAFVSHAYDTEIKQRMIDHSISPVLEWLLSDETIKFWPSERFAPTKWLYDKYAAWVRATDGFPGYLTQKYFQRMMGEMNELGLVSMPERKTLKGKDKLRGYVRYNSENTGSQPTAAEVEFVYGCGSSGSLLTMQQKMKAKTR